ncbi:phosphotransferase family protein [Yinghuangia soli]|uniref:Phosphotransferase family protein n=1 Tax=Yinghuangia soli TaxID=2908204 RepID=A0AA41U754_9ACTN|nr:phosphotransferase family protein [Yinghuangia soli]MCF2531629.1 phosphotransferase family protein [Yinghuangia soli]
MGAEQERGTQEAAARPRTSDRDGVQLRAAFQDWLRKRVGDPEAAVVELRTPSANGMSSETLLVTARWAAAGERRVVVRLAPPESVVPVFPEYDLAAQFGVMRQVREATGVPVPEVFWHEPDPGALGAPFLVMAHVDGRIPPDVMPYVYGSWVTELDAAARTRMQEATVDVLAELHGIPDAAERFAFLERTPADGRSALRRHVDATRAFAAWAKDGLEVPLLDAGFAWLEEHWPSTEGPAVLSWGDSRIGNIMYSGTGTEDALPVAVLDWEMAGVGVPEIDLAWLVYLHGWFQSGAERRGVPGLPDFLGWDDVAARYEARTGYRVADREFYTVYTALRMAVVSLRTQLRAVAFGELAMPDDPDDLIRPRTDLGSLIGV